MDIKQKISDWMDGHSKELLQDLISLCRIRSVGAEPAENAPFGEGAAKALDAAMALCEKYGLAVCDHDRQVMTADMGGERVSERVLDILAHLDVVEEGKGWDTDPYDPVIRDDGCIYGRGVADDKGGAVAALYAMRCVRELGLPLSRGCRLILGTDEEQGSRDVAHYYKTEKPAPYTFSPDAEFPVCNAEKGFYRLRFRKSWEAESAVPRVSAIHAGNQINVMPTEAYADVAGIVPLHLMAGASPLCAELGASCRVEEIPGGARLTVVGRGCHASTPELGINPNTALIRVLCELPMAECESTRALRVLDRLLPHGDFLGKSLGIAQEDDVTGALTCVLTKIDLTDTGLEGLCDCRVPLCATAENCKDVAHAALAQYGFETAGMMVPPHYTPADSPFVKTLLKGYETFTGKEGGCYSMGGGTYVHDVPGGVAFGVIMPGTDTRIHGANERIPVADLITAAKIFAWVIAALCAEETNE